MTKLILAFSLLVCISAVHAGATSSDPKLKFENGQFKLNLPNNFLDKLKKDHPKLSLPESEKMPRLWRYIASKEKALPFICWGDFNGDRSIDFAAILVGPMEEEGMFVIYHGASDQFVKAYEVKIYENSPYEFAIKTLRKNVDFVYPISSRDRDRDIHSKFENDSILYELDDTSVSIIYFKNGTYQVVGFGS